MSYLNFLKRLHQHLSFKQCIENCVATIDIALQEADNAATNRDMLYDNIITFLNAALVDRQNHKEDIKKLLVQRAQGFLSLIHLLSMRYDLQQKNVQQAKRRTAGYENRIKAAWSCGAYELFDPNLYNPRKPLTKHFMEPLCHLAETAGVSRENGTKAVLSHLINDSADFVSPAHIKKTLHVHRPPDSYQRGRQPDLDINIDSKSSNVRSM